jgi:hypothetical protein
MLGRGPVAAAFALFPITKFLVHWHDASSSFMVSGPLAFTYIGSLECTEPDTSQLGSGWVLLRSGVETCCATNSFLMSSSASSFSPLLVKMGVDPCGFRSLAVS